MIPAFIIKLGFYTWLITIGTKKIDVLDLKIYDIIIAKFFIQDKLDKI